MSSIFKAITFDMFGTLVELDQSRLPRMNIDGKLLPSLFAAPFRLLRELFPTADLGDALVAFSQARGEFEAMARLDPTRERAPHALFARCLERMGMASDAVAVELAESQMKATIAAAIVSSGAVELLTQLQDRGYALGLVSNLADARGGHTLLAHLDLGRYFHSVVFSGEVGCRKPGRRIFEVALSTLGATAAEALHIGDELEADIRGAGQCGVSTVWVNAGEREFTGEHLPRLEIPGLRALADWKLLS